MGFLLLSPFPPFLSSLPGKHSTDEDRTIRGGGTERDVLVEAIGAVDRGLDDSLGVSRWAAVRQAGNQPEVVKFNAIQCSNSTIFLNPGAISLVK